MMLAVLLLQMECADLGTTGIARKEILNILDIICISEIYRIKEIRICGWYIEE
jgi:hypothetical protein